MKAKLFISSAIVLFAIVHLSCSDDSTNPRNSFSGITMTDESGNVMGGDQTDWCYGQSSTVAGRIPNPPVPTSFAFYPAYPNPCNGTISFRFDLPVATRVDLVVRATLTKTVAHVLEDQDLDAGTYDVVWGLDDDGDVKLADGVYRVYLTAGDFECYGDIQILNPDK